MNEIWNKSIREEIIATLWFIVAFVSKPYVHKWIYFAFIVFAIISFILSVLFAYSQKLSNKLNKES